jgi:hemerythrin-like domain-containing protein
MSPEAVKIIKDEHLTIAAVLYCLRYHAHQFRYENQEPDFLLLSAILDYLSSYPDRCHHPKEESTLFAAIAKRTDEADSLIRQLEGEHQDGYAMVEHMKLELLAFQHGEPDASVQFFNAVEAYAALEHAHMRSEEDRLLTIAEKVLTTADWKAIGASFRENDNPLFGIRPKQEADRLYRRILELAPTPLGYGKRSA